MLLPKDIIDRVQVEFPKDGDSILKRLAGLQSEDPRLFCDRILRCIVYAAWMRPRYSLEYQIKEARNDYRDLIMGTEYDQNENHVHDFNKPFQSGQFLPALRVR